MILTAYQKSLLILLARNEILSHLNLSVQLDPGLNNIPDALKVKCGVFVSVYVEDKLRGCLGTFSEEKTLYSNVKRMALSAAAHDSRFLPVAGDEVQKLKIEISVLSPRKAISGPEEIEIGRHGIFIEQGTARGTFLPQVAKDQNWTAEEFLARCSENKAGIGREGWKTARLFTYEALVFDSEGI